MVRRGLVFLCAYESPAALERTRMVRPSNVPSVIKVSSLNGPQGRALHLGQYGTTSLYYDKFGDVDLTGGLTIITRRRITADYYPTIFSKSTRTDGNFAITDRNVPVHFGCNNYYTYGSPYLRFNFFRANASSYRSSDDVADGTYQPPNNTFLDIALVADGVITNAPTLYYDGRTQAMSNPAGSATGSPTDNAGNIHLSSGDFQNQYADFIAVFRGQLTRHEIINIFNAPYGELFEDPATDRRMFFYTSSAPASSSTNQNATLLGVGD